MNTIFIKLNDYITCNKGVTPDEGEPIYNHIVESLKKGDNVILDFSNVEMMTTAFLNVVIGNLYKDYTSEQLKSMLSFENLSESIAFRIKKEGFISPFSILAISRMETWHISESRCCVSPISFRAARILIPNLPKSSTGIIVHLNNILSCRLRLWNGLIILVNKHDCSGCGPDLIGESLLNK